MYCFCCICIYIKKIFIKKKVILLILLTIKRFSGQKSLPVFEYCQDCWSWIFCFLLLDSRICVIIKKVLKIANKGFLIGVFNIQTQHDTFCFLLNSKPFLDKYFTGLNFNLKLRKQHISVIRYSHLLNYFTFYLE